MTAHTCPCCDGTGRLDPDAHPMCATAVQQRDRRSPSQNRRFAFLQRLALRDVAYSRDGRPLDPHRDAYVDYVSGEVRR